MGTVFRAVRGVACLLWITAGGGAGCGTLTPESTGAESDALTQITETIPPADARGIRRFPGEEPFLLDFLAIKEGTADRTVIELDLDPIEGQLVRAALNLGISNIDPDNGEEGIIDVYAYAGDGTVTADEFFAGTLFTSFTYNEGPGVISVDITAAVAQRIAAGDRYLGLNLRAATNDRFFLGATVSEPEPSMTFTMAVFGPLDAIAEAEAAVPDVPGAPALLAQLDQARKKIEQAEARFAEGGTAQARQAFCQARKKLDDFIAKVGVFVSAGRLTPAQGSDLLALAEAARDLLDERMTHLGLAACDP